MASLASPSADRLLMSPENSFLCRWYDFAWVAADELKTYFEDDLPQAHLLRLLM